LGLAVRYGVLSQGKKAEGVWAERREVSFFLHQAAHLCIPKSGRVTIFYLPAPEAKTAERLRRLRRWKLLLSRIFIWARRCRARAICWSCSERMRSAA